MNINKENSLAEHVEANVENEVATINNHKKETGIGNNHKRKIAFT